MRNPFNSTGWVVRSDSGRPRFHGTCFGLYRSNVMLTAQHVLGDASPNQVSVTIQREEVTEGVFVERIVRHPTADLAILFLHEEHLFDYFEAIGRLPEIGSDVVAFGYPEDTMPDGPRPTPRLFKGHIQREYEFRSHLDFQYLAAELSFGAPGGLSGGPVAQASLPARAVALVAENHESSTFLSSQADIVDGNQRYHEEVRSVVSYATAVLLEPYRDWLNGEIRPGLLAHTA